MQTKALFNALHQSLAKMKPKTPGNTLLDAEDEASSDTLAVSLGQVRPTKLARHE